MKKFVIKLVLFLLPFAAAIAVETFVLPIDFFTFRVWEALRVQGTSLTPGKFYPHIKLQKEEVGREGHNSPYEVKKKVTWITDKYGYRKKDTDEKPEVVIIGDSFIAGDGLDQHEMLSEQLEKKIGKSVYPVATANIRDFMTLPRFYDTPPSVVILEKLERTVHRLKKPTDRPFKRNVLRLRQKLSEIPAVRFIDIAQNRIGKGIMLQYTKARLSEWMGLQKFNNDIVKNLGSNKLVICPPARSDVEKEKNIEKIVSRLIKCKEAMSARGIRFIFMPIPNKCTVYHKIANYGPKHSFIKKLIVASRQAGIETVDVESAFQNALEKNSDLLLYIPDDSHWNEKGAEITADMIAEILKTNSRSENTETAMSPVPDNIMPY